MLYKKWITAQADKVKASSLSEKLGIDAFTAYLLVSRGIDDELTASEFLSDSRRLVSPFSFKDMDKAVNRINAAVESNEKICIYGDYDCDGVTATALLYSFLQTIGADVIYFIPDRITDGYGMNFAAIDKIKELNTNLIITVDNGIAAVDEADYIYSLGMELIVTDHHQLADKLPRACAVINPHREDNDIPFRDFAGVGVAFKLVCALYDEDCEDIISAYADYITIGTIGDMVPLLGENRSLVKTGLKLINSDIRPGITALKEVAGVDGELNSTDIAFKICPRINAAGRMSSASAAVELLISTEFEYARDKAEQLNIENSHRHRVEEDIIEDIEAQREKNPALFENRVIVVSGRNFHKGVIGICASYVVEHYGKPAIVISVDENNAATGSARSVEGFNIFEAISSCADYLTHYGGHPLAAGIGLNGENISSFTKAINDFAAANYPAMPIGSLRLDCKLSPFYLNVSLADNISRLEPFGADNMQPIFGLYNLTLKSVEAIGNGKHLKLEAVKKGKLVRMVMFKTTLGEFPYEIGEALDFAVKISKNLFKGREYLSVHIVDCRKADADIDRYYKEKGEYDAFVSGKGSVGSMYPGRDECVFIYKYLKKRGGYRFDIDDLYFELCGSVNYGQLRFAVAAFCEAGLITLANGICLNDVKGKVDLKSTRTLIALNGRR